MLVTLPFMASSIMDCSDRSRIFQTGGPLILEQGYVFTLVCHFVHGGVPGQVPPGQVHLPWAGTPPRQVDLHPPGQVHPLGRDTPPRSSSYWEIRATSGRRASYWNAFLFVKIFCRKLHANETRKHSSRIRTARRRVCPLPDADPPAM